MGNELTFPAIKRLPTGRRDVVMFEVPEYGREAFWKIAKKAAKLGDWFRIKVMLPARKRSTGEHSQCNHFNGHCQQIAAETGNSFTAVKERMKTLALSRGYPGETLVDGSLEPKSEGDATVEESILLIDTVHQFADEWEIYLIEEDADGEEPKET